MCRQPAHYRIITGGQRKKTDNSFLMTTLKTGISVVVPVYNSAPQIGELAVRVQNALKPYQTDFELILVNDQSADNSWSVIEDLAKKHSFIKGINLARNSGQHNALLCGIRAARYSVCITLDDDLQFVPEDIPQLLTKLNEGFDLVYGTPLKQQHGLWRNFASLTTKLALNALMGTEMARHISPFRAFKTKLRDAFKDATGDVTLVDVLLSWGTNRYGSVRVQHLARATGRSNYSFSKLVLCAFNMITGFTTIPLRVATINGLLCVGAGLILLAYVFYRYFENGGSVPGFPFLASVIIIFSGAQLFALGIIGEYMGRMYSRTLNRPSYIIESIVTSDSSPEDPECKLEAMLQQSFAPDRPQNIPAGTLN